MQKSMDSPMSIPERTVRFFKTIQAGDIALFEVFEEALAVFGYTKVGKTTSCHIMCGSSVKSEEKRGQLVYNSTLLKFRNAKIGQTHESETEIPNIFEGYIKNKDKNGKPVKLLVLDQPGYGDTYGFHRIFSNGYFHYRTFSKTPKLKFLIVISKNDLTGTGEKFKKTIRIFINTFKDWQAVKKNVMNATSFLITKAQPNTKIENLKEIIRNLRGVVSDLSSKQAERYQSVVDVIINSGRLFFIEKPNRVNLSPIGGQMLQQIYENSSFWERPIYNNVVDMSPINFSVASEIMKELRDKGNERFHQEFDDFMQYMQRRMMQMIVNHPASLVNTVMTLQEDAVCRNDSHKTVDEMKFFNQEFYKFMPEYNTKRTEREVNLFKELDTDKWGKESLETVEQEMKKTYFIKKIKVLEYLELVNLKIEEEFITADRTIKEIEQFSTLFIAIFKKFSILSLNHKDRTIYKYSYIIQRLIEESKILSLILFSSQKVREDVTLLGFKPVEDIFRLLKDRFFANILGDIKSADIKQQFMQEIDLSTLTTVNQEVIDFFLSIKGLTQEIKFKLANLLNKFTEQILPDPRASSQEKKYAARHLFQLRRDFYTGLQNQEKEGISQELREHFIQLIFKMTRNLAELLKNLCLHQFARECYRSINNAHQVFQIYQTEKNAINDSKQKRQLLLKYASEAGNFGRKELALKCCQQAYDLSETFAQMKEAAEQIVAFSTEKKGFGQGQEYEDPEKDKYLRSFVNEDYCCEFSTGFSEDMEMDFCSSEEP